MSGIDLDAIRARAAAARQAAASGTTGLPPNIDGLAISDALDIFAESAADVPALLDEVERLRADRDAQGRFLSTVDKFARASAMSHDAVLGAVGVKADLDRAEATIARVRKLADSWDDLIAEERNQKRTWCAGMIEAAQSDLRAAIEGTDS